MSKIKWMLLLVALIAVPLLAQTPQKIADINKKVVGKWWSSDRKSYIEFLPSGVCSEGTFYGGTWHIEEGKLGAWEQGKEFICLGGALTLIAPNILTRDHGMGGEPTRYYRGCNSLRLRLISHWHWRKEFSSRTLTCRRSITPF